MNNRNETKLLSANAPATIKLIVSIDVGLMLVIQIAQPELTIAHNRKCQQLKLGFFIIAYLLIETFNDLRIFTG